MPEKEENKEKDKTFTSFITPGGLSLKSYRWSLAWPFLLLFMFSLAFAGYLIFLSGRTASMEMTRQAREEMVPRVRDNLDNLFYSLQEVLTLNMFSLSEELIDPGDYDSWREYFTLQGEAFRNLRFLSIGTDEFGFTGLELTGGGGLLFFQSGSGGDDSLVFKHLSEGADYSMEGAVSSLADCTAVSPSALADPPLHLRFLLIKESSNPLFLGMLPAFCGEGPLIFLGCPCTGGDGEFLGAFAAAVSLSGVQEILNSLYLGSESMIWVEDAHGKVLISGNSNVSMELAENFRSAIKDSGFTGKDEISLAYKKGACSYLLHMAPYRNSFGTDWRILLALSEEDVINPLRIQILRSLFSLFCLFVVAVILILFISRKMVEPVLRLNNSVKDFIEGKGVRTLYQNRRDEIGELSGFFEKLARDFQGTIGSLKTSKSRYKGLFEYSPSPLWEEDASSLKKLLDSLKKDGIEDLRSYLSKNPEFVEKCINLIRVIDVNRAALDLFGYSSKDEFLNNFSEIFDKGSYDHFIDELAVLYGGATFYKTETVTSSKGGGKIEGYLHIYILPGSEQSWSRWIVSMFDITDKNKTEEQIRSALLEKETLLKELHHRTKNNMQIISALLSLECSKNSGPGLNRVMESTEARIHSMALVHEQLYNSVNLSTIDLKNYIADLVFYLEQSFGVNQERIRINLDAQPLFISLEKAVPLGIILNELISNSMKYAFPDGKSGHIRIELREIKDKTIRLIVSDNGVGIASEKDLFTQENMGLFIVHSLVLDQLKGALDIRTLKGTEWIISFDL